MCASPHRLEELRIFRGLHGDLGVEHQIVRQLGQLRHQLHALLAQRLQLMQSGRIGAAARLRQILEGHRIEIVVGQGDEPESETPQFHDLARPRGPRRAAAVPDRPCARPSRTSSASDSRARSAPRPTCSVPWGADPIAPIRSGRRRCGRLRRPAPTGGRRNSPRRTFCQTTSPSPRTTA